MALWEKARGDCVRIVDMILAKYRPRRLIQWGSLLEAEQFDERSDIDLAVEGITDPAEFFALLGDAMRMTEFRLDIVQMEKIEPEFADLIRMKGKVLHES